jgi:acyl carrier protein
MRDKVKVVLDIINELREEKGELPLNEVTETTSLREGAGVDSIDLAVLTGRLDEQFGSVIFADGIVETIGEVMEKIG